MSLGSVLSNVLSGLQTSQTALKTISQNVANANTPGYVRTSPVLTPRVIGAAGSGVEVSDLRRAADRFLQAAYARATASSGAAQAKADLLDRAQSAFGDPTSDASLFTRLDATLAGFQGLVSDVTSPVARRGVIDQLETLFATVSSVARDIESLTREADQRLSDGVARLNDLLGRISNLNSEVALARRAGVDATGAENLRDQLIDEVSALIDVRMTAQEAGTVEIRTASGALLVGQRAATLTHTANGAFFSASNQISVDPPLANGETLDRHIGGGQLRGLIEARDVDLPAYGEVLGELGAAIADELNAVHNQNSSASAAQSLVGRQTGLLATDTPNFSGRSIIAAVDASGAITRRLTIDFSAGQIISESPASTTAFANTIGGFTAALSAALGAAPSTGSANFANGVMRLDAVSGLVIQDDASTPSARQARGFAHFFGLNDLVRRGTPSFFETGVSAADAHGIASGAMTLRVSTADGARVMDRTITPTGATWASLVADLNNVASGVGGYATFSVDAQGKLSFAQTAGFKVEVIGDTTQRGTTGVSTSALFGLDRAARAGRAIDMQVNASVRDNPQRLALGRPDVTAPILTRIVESLDGRGAAALANVRDVQRRFAAAGTLPAQTATLGAYVSRIAAEAARAAGAAERAETGATEVAEAARQRRSQTEGVSLDDELVLMTQFQQSYAAASRVMQAASDMFEILLQIR
jgi:flagellar hook-associated protein 1 FlgK